MVPCIQGWYPEAGDGAPYPRMVRCPVSKDGALYPGMVPSVRGRCPVAGDGILCPGMVPCVHGWCPVSMDGVRCPGMVPWGRGCCSAPSSPRSSAELRACPGHGGASGALWGTHRGWVHAGAQRYPGDPAWVVPNRWRMTMLLRAREISLSKDVERGRSVA